jgi:hypothetical protein
MGKFLLVANRVCLLLNIGQVVFYISSGTPALALLPAVLILINYVAVKRLSLHLNRDI